MQSDRQTDGNITGVLFIFFLNFYVTKNNKKKKQLLLVKKTKTKTFHFRTRYYFAVTMFKQHVNLPLVEMWRSEVCRSPAEGMFTNSIEVWGFKEEWLNGVKIISSGIVLLRRHFHLVDHINFLKKGERNHEASSKNSIRTNTQIKSMEYLWTATPGGHK